MFIVPRTRPYGITAHHCAADNARSLGRNAATSMIAERTTRSPTVPIGPSAGNRPLASAAPAWTLTIAARIAGADGLEMRPPRLVHPPPIMPAGPRSSEPHYAERKTGRRADQLPRLASGEVVA